MRKLVRDLTIAELEKRVKIMEQHGWKAISDIKVDSTEVTYNTIYYVCVMEKQDRPHTQKSKWGHIY